MALVGLGLGLGVAHAGRPVAAPAGLVVIVGTHGPKVAGLVVINGNVGPKVSGLVTMGTRGPKIQGR